jgi:hypothetical protein
LVNIETNVSHFNLTRYNKQRSVSVEKNRRKS